MLGTCPNLAHAVGYLSRFSDNPSDKQWQGALHVLCYIRGTLDYGILYSPTAEAFGGGFTAYSDAAYSYVDWAGCPITSKSTMGYVFLFSGSAISWLSHLQSRVATSSCDAEYISLGHTGKEDVHLNQQLTKLSRPLTHPITLFGNNQGANASAEEPRFHKQTKHIRLAEHFARKMVKAGTCRGNYIPTTTIPPLSTVYASARVHLHGRVQGHDHLARLVPQLHGPRHAHDLVVHGRHAQGVLCRFPDMAHPR